MLFEYPLLEALAAVAREGSFEAAAEQYAYAVVLSERKSLDTSLIQEKLLSSSVASADR